GVTDKFDLVMIDCAPSLGLNTTSGLAAADSALLVVEPSVFGLRGVGPALDLIEDVWASDNSGLDLSGVVLNRVPAVSSAAQDRIADLKKMVGSKSVWTPYVPQRVLINQAHHERAPIHSFGAQGRELASLFDTLLRKLQRSFD
ncbi:MAG: ParA family protein, partial [Actinomycetia bacterium]|nr:ParA family protein [Actinomycetes bacterium]